jgi:hypothetical protein
LKRDHPEQMQAVCMAGVDRENLAAKPFRVAVLSELECLKSMIEHAGLIAEGLAAGCDSASSRNLDCRWQISSFARLQLTRLWLKPGQSLLVRLRGQRR